MDLTPCLEAEVGWCVGGREGIRGIGFGCVRRAFVKIAQIKWSEMLGAWAVHVLASLLGWGSQSEVTNLLFISKGRVSRASTGTGDRDEYGNKVTVLILNWPVVLGYFLISLLDKAFSWSVQFIEFHGSHFMNFPKYRIPEIPKKNLSEILTGYHVS